MITAETLLSEIMTFCEANKLSPTKFGQLVANDRHLVHRLRAGKTLTLKRIEQVQAFMAAYRPKDNAPEADDPSNSDADQIAAVAEAPQITPEVAA